MEITDNAENIIDDITDSTEAAESNEAAAGTDLAEGNEAAESTEAAESNEAAENIESTDIKRSIEAILFAYGKEVPVDDIATALDISKKEVCGYADELAAEYLERDGGIRIVRINDCYEMCTAEAAYDAIVKLVHVPKKHVLTDVMLETLAIVCYRQPVTRGDIESIRGVKSDFALNKLIEYGLVCELGRKDAPGRPILFGTTNEFLKIFGMSSSDDAPMISEEKIEEFTKEAMDENNVVVLDNL